MRGAGDGDDCRTVAQLLALSDEELERTDLVEMHVAVARRIPGLEKLDYERYRKIVDGWTGEFSRWLGTVEYAFGQSPEKFHNDVNFFRLGMLAQFLDQHVGIAYVEERKQAQLEAQKMGRNLPVFYTDPGQLLLHGLIDTKRGTCATMPALHVAIGRRLGWPVSLACVKSHYVCRYDDGKVVYNIEATDTGRGGFAADSDAEYIKQEGLSRRAVACGSDLRSLSVREMLGVCIAHRGRHYVDTNRPAEAGRDYALAHSLFPTSRKIHMALTELLIWRGCQLFDGNEKGHPRSWARHMAACFGLLAGQRPPAPAPSRPSVRPRRYGGSAEEVHRFNEQTRREMDALFRPKITPSRVPQLTQPVDGSINQGSNGR